MQWSNTPVAYKTISKVLYSLYIQISQNTYKPHVTGNTQKAHDGYEKIFMTISLRLLVFPQGFPWLPDIQQFPVAQLQHPGQTNGSY